MDRRNAYLYLSHITFIICVFYLFIESKYRTFMYYFLSLFLNLSLPLLQKSKLNRKICCYWLLLAESVFVLRITRKSNEMIWFEHLKTQAYRKWKKLNICVLIQILLVTFTLSCLICTQLFKRIGQLLKFAPRKLDIDPTPYFKRIPIRPWRHFSYITL